MTSWSVFSRVLAISRRECYNVPLQVNRLLGCKNNFWKEHKSLHVSATCRKLMTGKTLKVPTAEDIAKKSWPVVNIWENMTVEELAEKLECNPGEIIALMPFQKSKIKNNSEIKQISLIHSILSQFKKRSLVVSNPNKKAKSLPKSLFTRQPPPKPEDLIKRPPVVAVMGHVDHGKTTLLDALRNTFVVDQEFGGITQHIGAFSVQVKSGEKVTFIDTPGHAAFTAMRSRGAEVTDFVVLVVAADDGIMEQTVQSINIINRANVPMIVAVNKIDKPNAKSIDKIKRELLLEGVQVEDEGGDIQMVPISALKKINLDLLVETILTEAEVLNLKGDPKGMVEGVIIESKVEKIGVVATLIVKRGTLKKGKVLVAGKAFAKVRLMLDENKNEYKEATPSTPVQVYGWRELPSAGEEVFEVESERLATRIVKHRENELKSQKQEKDQEAISEKLRQQQQDNFEKLKRFRSFKSGAEKRKFIYEKNLELIKYTPKDDGPFVNLVLKGDVNGTVEVLTDVLGTYHQHDECALSIVHAAVGDVTQSDVELAELFQAIIYAFNVDVHPSIRDEIKGKELDIRFHNVLYKLIDDLKGELNSKILPVDAEEIQGEAEVLQHFNVTHGKKKVPVAGCKCLTGNLLKDSLYRVKRGDEIIYEGKLISMKHHKTEVKSVKRPNECGLMFESFPGSFKTGDVIICYNMIKVPRTTSWNPGF